MAGTREVYVCAYRMLTELPRLKRDRFRVCLKQLNFMARETGLEPATSGVTGRIFVN